MNDASTPARAESPVGTFWMIELQRQAPGGEPSVPHIHADFVQVDAEQEAALASLAEAMGLDDPGTIRERFASGRRCYAAVVDGAFASYCWVSLVDEWISEVGLSIQLAPGAAYIWDCATLPAYRGQGLYPALLSFILGRLRAEGLRRVWIGADTHGFSSQKGIIRAGFQPIADVYVTRGAHTTSVYVSGRPMVDDELVREIRRFVLP